MNIIAADTKCILSVVPAGTSLYDQYKGKEFKATDKMGADGKNQQFVTEGTKAIYGNGGNGFLFEAA